MEHTAIFILEDNLCHIFHNKSQAIIIDPAEPDIILKCMSKKLTNNFYKKDEIDQLENIPARKIIIILTTHHHWDHSAGNAEMLKNCDRVLKGHSERDYNIACSEIYKEGLINVPDAVDITIQAIHTPCHTRDSYCLLVKTKNKEYLVTGDTIFYLGVGMFFEGSASEMANNIAKIKNMVENKQTIVLYGHDYRQRNIPFVERYWKVNEDMKEKIFLTLEEEEAYNPFFNCLKINSKVDEADTMGLLRDQKNKM